MTAASAFSVFKERYASDIRFWIIVFFLVRLYGITDPPLEISHNWRQVTGNMVARNFYSIDNNILYPRLDIGGEKTGITGTEFPVLNYLVYLFSLVFGFYDWFGRLINLLVSSLGIFYFYKLLKFRFSEKFSFTAAFLLLVSSWLMFSRKVMPDTFSTSLVIMALYFAFEYFRTSEFKFVLLYFVLSTLGVLSKIPAIYLLSVLVFPMLDRTIAVKNKIWISLFSLLMLIPVAWWYFVWVPFLTKEFGFEHYYMGTSFSNGLKELAGNLMPTFERFYFDALKFSGFILCIAGLVAAILRKEKALLWIFGLCAIAWAVFMLKAGRNFYHHGYYILPFIPVMCLFTAYALSLIRNKIIYVLLMLMITAESIANQQHDFFIKKSERYKLSLVDVATQVCGRQPERIVINGGKNPQLMYFTHLNGWTATDEQIADETFLKEVIGKGCVFLFLDKHTATPGSMASGAKYRKVFENEDFVVYSLRN